LVPETPLHHAPWTVEGRVIPAKQVGGDYYDYFPVGEGRLGIVIADVSGKGVPAALLVSTVQGTLRAFSDGRVDPIDVVGQVNRAVVRNTAGGKFVTLFYGEADPATGLLRYVNAGHNYPLLRRADGTLEMLKAGGVPLGIFEAAPYLEASVAFGPEDSLLLFSDGITEAVDMFLQEYGDERLEALWAAGGGHTPGEFIASVMAAVAEFRGGAAQNDDMTAVVIGRHAPR
ncbi:MAG: PP2C family protein-serine/threonine phosphatase, partial [Candidatus Eisenbacteria bacterium]